MKELNINMLSEKYKQIIEDMALELQNILNVTDPNNYNIIEIENFLNDANCKITYSDKSDSKGSKNKSYFNNEKKSIYIDCNKNKIIPKNNETIYTQNYLKVLFHEIWHFMSSELGLNPDKNSPETIELYPKEFPATFSEISANYFSRAMIMPKDIFIKKVAENTALSGVCNVFELAKFFKVEFSDVIARGKDLNLWNMKVGV